MPPRLSVAVAVHKALHHVAERSARWGVPGPVEETDREMNALLAAFPEADEERRGRILTEASAFDARVSPRTFSRLPALTRLKWHLAQRGLTVELVKVVRWERTGAAAAIVRWRGRRYVTYPYWGDPRLRIPRKVYRARTEIQLKAKILNVSWRDGLLHVRGEARIRSYAARHRWASLKAVRLRDSRSGRVLWVPARAEGRRHVPANDPYRWAGFSFRLRPERLSSAGCWRDSTWQVEMIALGTGVFRTGTLWAGEKAVLAGPCAVGNDVRVVPVVAEGQLAVKVETVRAKVTSCGWFGNDLEVRGTLHGLPAGPPPTAASLTLRSASGSRTRAFPVTLTSRGDGAAAFAVRLGARDLAGEPVAELGGKDGASVDDTYDWRVGLSVSAFAEPLPLAVEVDLPEAGRLGDGNEIRVAATPEGYLRLIARTARFSVTACQWRADGTLVLTGHPPAGERMIGEIVLRGRGQRTDCVFPMALVDSGLRAEVPLAGVRTLAGTLPLAAGSWQVLFRPSGLSRQAKPIQVDRVIQARLPTGGEVAGRRYDVEISGLDGLTVRVHSNLRASERGEIAQQRLRDQARRRAGRRRLRDAVLFSCYAGRQYSDNPRAIHEELVRRDWDGEQLWVVNDAQVELPGTLRAVRLKGADWHDALASARYIVTNHRLGDWFHRHPDQIVVQTWHGTPLKRLGRDLTDPKFAYKPGIKGTQSSATRKPRRDAEWTHLVSPNPFSTEILRRAFSFDGEVLEVGYPRNDVLYHPDAPAIADRVRERIGIPPGKRVILYAPTWRDDQYYGPGRYRFELRLDVEQAAEAWGEHHVLLIRLHPNVVDGVPERRDGFLWDVSAYPDVAELYLIADVLVTDYSSAMFDYANTGRPMLFFCYDLEHYRDVLRGFYLDFAGDTPGPLLESCESVLAAVANIDTVANRYRARYERFTAEFCPWDDGKAAGRVVDQIFAKNW